MKELLPLMNALLSMIINHEFPEFIYLISSKIEPTLIYPFLLSLESLGHAKDINPSHLSQYFGLMGVTSEGKLNQNPDRNAETDVRG